MLEKAGGLKCPCYWHGALPWVTRHTPSDPPWVPVLREVLVQGRSYAGPLPRKRPTSSFESPGSFLNFIS